MQYLKLENNIDDDDDDDVFFPNLTYEARFYGFIICTILGLVLNIISYLNFMFGFNSSRFAIVYSLGNIVSLLGTGFILGFSRQLQQMKEKKRAVTSMVFIISMGLTLLSAIYLKSKGLTMIFAMIQILSFWWYSLSFIPFGQTMVRKITGYVI